LYEGIIRGDGSWRYLTPSNQEETRARIVPEYRKGSSQDLIIPLVRQLVEEGKQVIVFRQSKGETRGCAGYLSSALGLSPATRALERLKVTDPSQASADLRRALGGGIGFHNADLEREERAVLEEEFRAANTDLRVLVATTTLAMGINTPASAVVVAGLEHPGAAGTPYSVAEYKNIIGRAGRLGLSESGESYLVALNGLEEHQLWNHYVLGMPEDLRSRFLEAGTDPRTLILRVLSAVERVSGHGLDLPALLGFLESSFGAFLMRRGQESWRWNSDQLAQAVAQLQSHELIQNGGDESYEVTALGRLAGESGTEVESIIRLAGALKGLDGPSCSVPTLITATQLTVELDDVLIPLNTKSVRKEPAAWFGELHARAVAAPVAGALHRHDHDGRDGVRRAKRAATCLYWIDGIPIAEIERRITQFGGGFGGAAGPIRAVARRTQDLISTVVRVMEILNPEVDLGAVGEDMAIRLQLGIAERMLPIAAACGSLLSRGEYLTMASRGMNDPAAILAAPAEELSGILGGPGRATTLRRLCADANENVAAANHMGADGREEASRT
jgi:helicase